ncbi:MAG: hypothetical protein M3441_29080, partial [Chloroflexota bacterium]|nr:hypothetical protein [Chloroflexota bacterium]
LQPVLEFLTAHVDRIVELLEDLLVALRHVDFLGFLDLCFTLGQRQLGHRLLAILATRLSQLVLCV